MIADIPICTGAMDSASADALPADSLPAPFAQALDRAEHDKSRTTLTRNGKPVAVQVPVEDAAALEAWKDAEDARLAAQARTEMAGAGSLPRRRHLYQWP